MKKILFAIISFIIPLALSAQWWGDGTSASTAYYGVINGSNTMSAWDSVDYTDGVIYVGRSGAGENDLEVGTGGTLTISHGVTVKFCTTSSDLRITGTGVLNASGSSSGYVTFTKNAQSTWGHITFEGSTGNSILDSCIIEHGSKTGSGIEGWGGGIHINTSNTSNLTVSYCLIRDNTAVYGGGVFVNGDVNPTIENCHIYSNSASTSGGGLYFWYNSDPKMENCIIDDNECTYTGATYGGGGLGVYTGSSGYAKITNCIIVNNIHNTTGTNRGDNIHLNSINAINFINCIVWSSDNSVYIDASPSSNNFINSAVQRVYNSSGEVSMSSYTNSFKLNSSNTGTNPDGPYFNATDGSDWSIQFRSPCRDAGTTPSPAIPNDYDGNPRIGPYDIGAYEVQYSRWKTDASSPTSWTNIGNWEQGFEPGHTGTTGDVAIPALSDSSHAPDISGTTSITSTKYMILEPGAKATFATLSNSGTLKLEADADSVASLIVTTFSGNDANIELYLTGGDAGDKDYRWHYVSSPVTALPVSTFAPTPTINFAQYIEGYPTDSLMQGWIAYDGFIYTTEGYDLGYEIIGTNLIVGQGYNYYDTEDYKFSFAGTLNTEDVNKALTFDTDETLHGFNLLGNPFSSGLNWDYIITHSYPVNTSKGLYFTRDNAQCSYIGGVGIPDGVTGIIPPMQGFFVKTYGIDNEIILAAAARTHNSIHERYKGKSIIPLVRLSVTEYSVSDETVIRFDEQAKPGLDYDFDALKMFLSDNKMSIYSYTGETKYAINGLPFPETEVEIPIVVNFVFGGIQMISAIQLQGLDNYHVTLKDLETGFDINLKTTPNLYFTASAGITTNRFVLTINNATGIEDIPDLPGLFNIFAANNLINIRTLSDAWNGKNGTVRIFDLTGRTVSEIHNKEFWKNSVLQVPAPLPKGIYFVEIRAGGERYVGKVSVVR